MKSQVTDDDQPLRVCLRCCGCGAGTPLQNNLTELWALLTILVPHLFDKESFDRSFDLVAQTVDMSMVGKARTLLQYFMLRREKVHQQLH